MDFFECCHYCKAPKRHPGCHDKCPDYTEAKELWDEHKNAVRQERFKESLEPPFRVIKKRKH